MEPQINTSLREASACQADFHRLSGGTYFVSVFDLCKSVAKKSKNGLARIVNSC
jgi:hypothetical protein